MKNTLFLVLLFTAAAQAQTITVGPGTGDQGAAIQNALNSGSPSVELVGGNVYEVGSFIVVPSNVTLKGNGAVLKPHSTLPVENTALVRSKTGSVYYSAPTTVTVTANSASFTCSGASTAWIGKIIRLYGPVYLTTADGDSYNHGLYDVVTGISGTTVTVSTASPKSYTASSVTVYTPTTNVHIKNLKLDLKGRATGEGFRMEHALNSSLDSTYVEGDANVTTGPTQGIVCVGVNLQLNYVNTKNLRPTYPTGSGTACHVNVNGTNIVIKSPTIYGGRTLITSGGLRSFYSNKVWYLNVNVDNGPGTGHALDFHANACDTRIVGGTVRAGINGSGPISVRRSKCWIYGLNVIIPNRGTTMRAIYTFEAMETDLKIERCTFTFTGTSGTNYVFQNSRTQMSPLRNFTFRKCTVKGARLALTGRLGAGIVIDSNRFETNGVYQSMIGISATALVDYTIRDNVFINKVGNVFNYSISTPDSSAAGIVTRDTVYIMDATNVFPQFRLNNTTNTVTGNVLYSPNAYFINDYSGISGQNVMTPNTWIKGVGVPPTEIGGEEVPPDPWEEPEPEEPPQPDDDRPGKALGKKKKITT